MANPFSPPSVLFPYRPGEPMPPAVDIDLSGLGGPTFTVKDGATIQELPDGSAEIDLSGIGAPPDPASTALDDRFNANLALKMDESELNSIASELIEGIERDEQGRTEHLHMLAEGLKVLGLQMETLTTTSITSSAPLEGMSTARHPLLTESCLLFQANAVGELLPAAGPVKIRDDRPREPQAMKDADKKARAAAAVASLLGHNGGPPLDGPTASPFASAQKAPAMPTAPAGLLAGAASAPGAGPMPPPAGAGGRPMMPGARAPGAAGGGANAQALAAALSALAAAAHNPAGAGSGSNPAGQPPNPQLPGQPQAPMADGGVPPMAQSGSAMAAPAGLMPPQPLGPQAGAAPTAPGAAAPAGQPAPAASPVSEDEEEQRSALADALQQDMNHYLTKIDAGYVRDSTQMFFRVGFGGLGIKKVYHDPLKRRPMSRSVNLEDFIVSKDVADLCDAERITQRIRMNKSVLRRMQVVGAYRQVDLGQPTLMSDGANQLKETIEEVKGVRQSRDPRDLDYEIFECYCLLQLDEFAPRKFRGKGLPLPYKVSVERYSRKILEIRRNWNKEDEECQPKQWFVDFAYVRAFGFYCIGLLHLLGNTTKALTACWREFLDAGQFANFPGFLYLKGAGRQLTNQFRIAPGSGVALDSTLADIRSAVMPLPYKSPDPAFVQFVQQVEAYGQKLGGTAMTPVSEGRADAPVGTTMALIEQAIKPLAGVLKGCHDAQARELELLKERFQEDPEAFWRFNKKPAMRWEKELFLKALNDFEMVPVSDPNNPTKLHRMAKAEAYRQVVTAAGPMAFDAKKSILKYCDEMGLEGVEETMSPHIDQISQMAGQQAQQPAQQQQPTGPSPQVVAMQAAQRHAAAQMAQQTAGAKIQADMAKQSQAMQDKAADRQNKLQIAALNQDTERLRLAATVATHATDLDAAEDAAHIQLASDHAAQAHAHENAIELQAQRAQQGAVQGTIAAQQQMQRARQAHQNALDLATHNADLAASAADQGPAGDLGDDSIPRRDGGRVNGRNRRRTKGS